MALKKIENEDRFVGFMVLKEGNRLQGILEPERITGQTDNGKERGNLAFRVTVAGTLISLDKAESTANVGDLVGVSITGATRVLMGAAGKEAALTFLGYGKAKPNQKPYHQFQVELDDGK
jgi:hypothetical protein